MPDEGVDDRFEVNDDRVRIECEVPNDDQSLIASAMYGAELPKLS